MFRVWDMRHAAAAVGALGFYWWKTQITDNRFWYQTQSRYKCLNAQSWLGLERTPGLGEEENQCRCRGKGKRCLRRGRQNKAGSGRRFGAVRQERKIKRGRVGCTCFSVECRSCAGPFTWLAFIVVAAAAAAVAAAEGRMLASDADSWRASHAREMYRRLIMPALVGGLGRDGRSCGNQVSVIVTRQLRCVLGARFSYVARLAGSVPALGGNYPNEDTENPHIRDDVGSTYCTLLNVSQGVPRWKLYFGFDGPRSSSEVGTASSFVSCIKKIVRRTGFCPGHGARAVCKCICV